MVARWQISTEALAEIPVTDEIFVEKTPLSIKLSGLMMTVISAVVLVLYLGTKQQLPGIVQIVCAATAVCAFAFLGYFWTQGNKKEFER